MTKDCNTCIHEEGSCYPSTTIFDKDKTCKSYDPDYEGYIDDLENKNRLLGERCNQLLNDKGELTDKIADIKANCDLAIEGRDIKIKELEQENTELTETLKTYNGCGDWDNDFHTCRVYLQHEELQMYIDQLTKAKEIIRGLYFIIQSRIDYENNTGISDEMWRAKQFLEETK